MKGAFSAVFDALSFLIKTNSHFFVKKSAAPFFCAWYHSWLLCVIVSNYIEIASVNEYNYEHFLARSLRLLAYIYLTSYNFVDVSVTMFKNLF